MSSKYNILVVDDDSIIRKRLEDVLSAEGFEVTSAASADECLQTAPFVSPDLIMLDVVMPEMDGYDLCMQLKEDPKLKEIPVIFISSLEGKEDLLKGYKAGGIDFIPKQVDDAIIVARVRAIIKMRTLAQDKANLMKANESLLAKVQTIFEEESLSSKIDMLKKGVAGGSNKIAEQLDKVRDMTDDSEMREFIDQVELSLEFGDRTSQQLNEIAKTVQKLHSLISDDVEEDPNITAASSASVFMEKKDQGEIDDLLSSLGL